MRIVQLANLYSPVSGGLRTAVDALGRGYAQAGHERALVIPGRSFTRRWTDAGLLVTVPGPSVAPGYRLVLDPRPVLRVLARLRPQVIEVSDKATLTVAAGWARRHGVRSVLFSHERLDAILAPRLGRLPKAPLERAADRWNAHLTRSFDAVVVTSAFGAAEFERVGAPVLHRIPLGVDLETFRPPATRGGGDGAGDKGGNAVRLVHLGRMSAEKGPGLALATVRELRARGVPVHLDMVGEGPQRAGLERQAVRENLPITFHGHVSSRDRVAHLLGRADVALATCPVESFGLAVLEALACGTPVVATDRGAAPELVGPGSGVAAPAHAAGFADGVTEVLRWPVAWRRHAARSRAECHPWSATIDGLLAVHQGLVNEPSGHVR